MGQRIYNTIKRLEDKRDEELKKERATKEDRNKEAIVTLERMKLSAQKRQGIKVDFSKLEKDKRVYGIGDIFRPDTPNWDAYTQYGWAAGARDNEWDKTYGVAVPPKPPPPDPKETMVMLERLIRNVISAWSYAAFQEHDYTGSIRRAMLIEMD